MASQKKNKKISDFTSQGSRSNAKPSREGGTGLASGEGSSGVGGGGGGGSNPTPGGNPGGILEAITRHANGKFTMPPEVGHLIAPPRSAPSPSVSSSPPFQSPLLQPQSPSTGINIPTPDAEVDDPSLTSLPASAAPSTDEWTKNISGFSGSPGNLISIMGDSPPTQPSSYEDQRHLSNWIPPQRTFANSPSQSNPFSTSPQAPQVIKRPLSFQLDTQHCQPTIETYTDRRCSMYSQYSAKPRAASSPQPTHEPQSHVYGAPDTDLSPNPKAGIKAGGRGYHFGFDSIPAYGGRKLGSDNVVLAGFEGGFEVYPFSKRSLENQLASLRGLRGGVINAKILPWGIPASPGDTYVAVVIHGPVLPQKLDDPERTADTAVSVRDGSRRSIGGFVIEYYQTTVEVYSLKTGQLVDVLLEAPKVRLANPVTSPIFKVPQPTGAFQVRADGGTVVVASGQTGECWVYRHILTARGSLPRFACVGKLWTCLQQTLEADTVQDGDSGSYAQPRRRSPQVPILALRGRWIAYCPAPPSSQIALKVNVPVPTWGRTSSINSMTPPQLPIANSELDLPEGNSVMNKILRETTQELIVGAKWVSSAGLRMWNDYWYKNPQHARSSPSARQSTWVHQDGPQFPPTHGTSAPALLATKDPGLVSVVDASTTGSSTTIHPIVTFSPQLGCSFLSFAPNGLVLFTASTKGDVQTLWDLMRIQYTKSSPLQAALVTSISGPRVRQIAQFSRMTVARVVDVAWTKPNGERVAVVTERGTVHVHDLPSIAFTWPPPRRRHAVIDPSRDPVSEGSNSATSAAVSIASSALSTAASVARPLITRPRRSSLQTGGVSGSVSSPTSIVDHASHGGRVIAASISSSLGKTGHAINHLRHKRENRVSLPSTARPPVPASVTWIAGKSNHTLAILGDGIVRQFPGTGRTPAEPNAKLKGVRSSSYLDVSVPLLPGDQLAPVVKRMLDSDELADLGRDDSCNTLVLDTQRRIRQPLSGVESSIPQAEIESSAPYQPFHTDRRVAIFTYNANTQSSSAHQLTKHSEAASISPSPRPSRAASHAAWTFGDAILTVRLDLGHGRLGGGDDDLGDDRVNDPRALPQSAMERLIHVGEDQEQIVVTTRRRRGASRNAAVSGSPEDNGLFEDDCVVLDFADQRV